MLANKERIYLGAENELFPIVRFVQVKIYGIFKTFCRQVPLLSLFAGSDGKVDGRVRKMEIRRELA